MFAHLSPVCGNQPLTDQYAPGHLHAEQSYETRSLLRWVPMFQTERIWRRVLKCPCRASRAERHAFQRADRRIARLFALPLLCVPVVIPAPSPSRQIRTTLVAAARSLSMVRRCLEVHCN